MLLDRCTYIAVITLRDDAHMSFLFGFHKTPPSPALAFTRAVVPRWPLKGHQHISQVGVLEAERGAWRPQLGLLPTTGHLRGPPQEPWDLTGTCKRVTAEEGAWVHMAEGLLGHAAGAPAATQSMTALPPLTD